MFASKYKPTTQKTLFHKDVVNHIRKWLKNIDDLSEYDKPVNRVLLVSGPIGCGKTTTIEILLKGYNTIYVNTSDLRTSEAIEEVSQGIPSHKDVTLANLCTRGKKTKTNIIVMDNIELCEKTIVQFIDTIHNKKSINIPIVMMTSNSRARALFTDNPSVFVLEMKNPALLELTKLTSDINIAERLGLEKEDIKLLVHLSKFDIRQLVFILEQRKYSSAETISKFIENVQIKHVDIDLIDKLTYMFDKSKPYDMVYIDSLASSEPMTISGGIFQNYSNRMHNIEGASDVAEAISQSNIMQSSMFNDQDWSLYDVYSVLSCVVPCYNIKSQTTQIEPGDQKALIGFKDISYNFINSYEEVKRVMRRTYEHKPFTRSNFGIDDFFLMANIFLTNIGKLNMYFDSNKKGKNTSKREKFELCNNITDPDVLVAWNNLVNQLYYHNLFEIDVSKLDVKTYINDEIVMRDITKVDLRIFRRFLNIFTMDDSNKVLKSNVETAIKYKLLKLTIEEICKYREQREIDNKTKADTLVEDLDKIWNF